jgi:hypothetical protein
MKFTISILAPITVEGTVNAKTNTGTEQSRRAGLDNWQVVHVALLLPYNCTACNQL